MCSRLLGAGVGLIAGIGIGLGITFYLYGTDTQQASWLARVLTGLVVGAIGALLGSVSGISRG